MAAILITFRGRRAGTVGQLTCERGPLADKTYGCHTAWNVLCWQTTIRSVAIVSLSANPHRRFYFRLFAEANAKTREREGPERRSSRQALTIWSPLDSCRM